MSNNVKTNADIAKSIENIQRILMLLLLEKGFTLEEVGKTVGLDNTTISKMFPRKVYKSLKKGKKQ
ncbi:MAG: hypothetical protein ACYS8W_17315 [Planctomycetota bacterium]|jgi:hypothetical protein